VYVYEKNALMPGSTKFMDAVRAETGRDYTVVERAKIGEQRIEAMSAQELSLATDVTDVQARPVPGPCSCTYGRRDSKKGCLNPEGR
jgi:hypothetical protein